MMKAIGISRESSSGTTTHKFNGSVDILTELELPFPDASSIGSRDLLVKVKSVGMNPIDVKKRKSVQLDNGHDVVILGYDGVGLVEQVGTDVSLFRVGDRVWFAGVLNRHGTNAEYTLVDERIVGMAPDESVIPTSKAAAVPLCMLTAWEGLFEELGLQTLDTTCTTSSSTAKTLLMVPGAGGVGSFVLQLAKKLCGLTVIATASRPQSQAACKALGADYVLNHHEPLGPQLDALGIAGVDYIYNAYLPHVYFDQYAAIIRPFGRIVSIVDDPDHPLPMHKLKLKRVSFTWELMFSRAIFGVEMIRQHAILNHAARLMECGLLQLPAVQVWPFSLESVKKLHEQQERGSMIGKAVMEML